MIKAVESALRKRLTLLENRTLISKLLHANQKMKTIKDYYRKYFQISSSVEVDFSTPMILSLYDFKLKKVMFDQILSITLHICDTDKGYCMVILPHGEIEIISSTNTDCPEGKRLDLDSVEEGIKQSIKRKEVLRSEDMKRLYVPMGVGGDIFGVIVIDRDKRFFSEDVELLSAIMVGASAAIELNLLKEKFYDINTQSLILLLNIAGLRDVELQRHLQRVSSIAGGFARFLGMSEKEVQDIEYAGLLHDIGKMGIGEEILNKKDPLNESEREKIEQHTKIGVDVFSSLTMLDRLIPIIYHHHERYDGSGYPDGLKEEEIPLGARIIAIVDAFDAITSKRPYREPLNEKDGLEEMKKFRGKIFDPNLLDKFEEYINKIILKGGKK